MGREKPNEPGLGKRDCGAPVSLRLAAPARYTARCLLRTFPSAGQALVACRYSHSAVRTDTARSKQSPWLRQPRRSTNADGDRRDVFFSSYRLDSVTLILYPWSFTSDYFPYLVSIKRDETAAFGLTNQRASLMHRLKGCLCDAVMFSSFPALHFLLPVYKVDLCLFLEEK